MSSDPNAIPPHTEIDLRKLGDENRLETGRWSESAIRSAVRFQAVVAKTGRVPVPFSDDDFDVTSANQLLRLTIVDDQKSKHIFLGEAHRIHSWARSVMKDEMNKLAARANATVAHGFSCSLHSADQRTLRYECGDYIAAELFQGQQELGGMRAWIENESPTTVYVQYPVP